VSRISDLLAAEYIARHCANPQCTKCIARARWYRRKGWRAAKTSTRKSSRKEVMPS
jgi:hypothetical protein